MEIHEKYHRNLISQNIHYTLIDFDRKKKNCKIDVFL